MDDLNIHSTIELSNRVKVPVIGFGTGDMEEEEKKLVAIIRNAIEAGYRHFDTAFIYHSERALGTALAESGVARESVFITSKAWDADMRRGPIALLRSFEESLRRLRTDYIDLYLLHWPVQGKLCESWRVLEQLYYTGRVRALGISNAERHHFMEIMTECEVMPHVHQDEFSPYCMSNYVRAFDRHYGIQFEAMMPLQRLRHEPIDGVIGKMAEKYQKNMQQIILRWDIQHGIVPLPKATKPEHMRSNLDIFDFALSKEDMEKIDALNREAPINWDTNNFCF